MIFDFCIDPFEWEKYAQLLMEGPFFEVKSLPRDLYLGYEPREGDNPDCPPHQRLTYRGWQSNSEPEGTITRYWEIEIPNLKPKIVRRVYERKIYLPGNGSRSF